jgi:hypothetical protein
MGVISLNGYRLNLPVNGPLIDSEDCQVRSEVQVFVPVNIGLVTHTDLRKRTSRPNP